MKDPDTDNLDAGWDDGPSDPPSVAVISSAPSVGPRPHRAARPRELDDLDAGWDDAGSDAPPPTGGRELPERGITARPDRVAVRPDRMSKRERRAFERQKRVQGEKRRAERREEEKRARREGLRREAAEKEAERRIGRERAEEARRAENAKRVSEDTETTPRRRPSKATHSRQRSAETSPKAETRRRRFEMPNGGWIVVVIGFITLGMAWYAFGR